MYDSTALTARVDEELRELFKRLSIGRYKADIRGLTQLDDDSALHGGVAAEVGTTSTGNASSGGIGGSAGKNSSTDGSGSKGTSVPVIFPTVKWVSESDGTREPTDIEDRAAKYIPESNMILINADFRGFRSLESYWLSQCVQSDAAAEQIRAVIQGEVAFILVEAVAAILLLKKDKSWDSQSIRDALSDEALTTVSLQRMRVDALVHKRLKNLSLL
jgi:hypothetical protein